MNPREAVFEMQMCNCQLRLLLQRDVCVWERGREAGRGGGGHRGNCVGLGCLAVAQIEIFCMKFTGALHDGAGGD